MAERRLAGGPDLVEGHAQRPGGDAAEEGVIFDEQHACAGARRGEGRADARRPAADDEDIDGIVEGNFMAAGVVTGAGGEGVALAKAHPARAAVPAAVMPAVRTARRVRLRCVAMAASILEKGRLLLQYSGVRSDSMPKIASFRSSGSFRRNDGTFRCDHRSLTVAAPISPANSRGANQWCKDGMRLSSNHHNAPL